MHRTLLLGGLLVVAVPGRAGADRDDAFCEVTPCLPGPIERRTLAHDEKLGRLWCKARSDAGVDSAGRLAFCTTARAQVLDGLPLAAGAYTLVHPNGHVYQSHLRRAHTFTLADGSTVRCDRGLIALTPDGALTYCELAVARVAVAGVPAQAGKGIAFHPDGRVAGATLGAPTTLAGLALPAGTSVSWDGAGALAGGWLAAPLVAQGLTIDSDFTLYPSGKLHAVELAADATVQGHPLPRGAQLELREDGTLSAAEFVEKRGFMIHGEMWTDTAHVTYDPAGTVTSHTTEHWQAAEPPHPPGPRGRR